MRHARGTRIQLRALGRGPRAAAGSLALALALGAGSPAVRAEPAGAADRSAAAAAAARAPSAVDPPGADRPALDGAPAEPARAAPLRGRRQGPWLLIAGAIATATAGAVLAYSSNAAERDVQDLYVGLGGVPPAFSGATRQRYTDAIAEGRRYERLAIASFSATGVLAAGAAVWLVIDGRRSSRAAHRVVVTPAIGTRAAGLAAHARF
jgi:hypothetical protein